MHKRQNSKNLSYYAKILVVISITLLLYGISLSVYNHFQVLDPVKNASNDDDGSTIHITTVDTEDLGEEHTPESGETPPEVTTPEVVVTPTEPVAPVESGGGTNYHSVEEPQKPVPKTPTLEEVNQSLRDEIQRTYGVTVHYGTETSGYSVANLSTTVIDNPTLANSQLSRLKNALSLYPSGMFQEIKNGGIPLTVYLIYSYSDNSVTGITDSSYTYANISIAAVHPFEESFYHESYHFIERYMFKNGASFPSWNSLNPSNFQYGTYYYDLSYSRTFREDAFFVNDYAQTSAAEDRASTFEYMMAGSKASCLNYGTVIWQKADYMARMIKRVLNSVRGSSNIHWEQYLY